MQKRFTVTHVASAFLCGSLFFSGLAMAQEQPIAASIENLKFFVQGEDRSSAEGTFNNQGTKVPEAFIYQGTTYVPVRMVSELLNEPIHWDGANKSVYIGEVEVSIVDAKGAAIGKAVLSAAEGGVRVDVEASGLTPGPHGFHLHEKAFVNNDFKTAGGHYNPEGKKHGRNNPDGHHAGDFDNLVVGANGKGSMSFVAEGLSLDKGAANSIWGKSFIIHAAEDDHTTDPAGNAGDRIAGGNIE